MDEDNVELNGLIFIPICRLGEAFSVDGFIELKVAEALAEDVGKGLARLDPEDMKAFNAVLGDLIEISGEKKTVARITGTFPEFYGKRAIQIDGITRSNAKANLGEVVKVKKIPRETAVTVLVTPLDFTDVLPEERELDQFAKVLQGLPVIVGDKINIPFLAGKERFFQVEATSPSGGVIINQKTKFLLKKPDFSLEAPSHVSYEDVGGLGKELRLVREMVELPLRYAEAFERLGIEAPKGSASLWSSRDRKDPDRPGHRQRDQTPFHPGERAGNHP